MSYNRSVLKYMSVNIYRGTLMTVRTVTVAVVHSIKRPLQLNKAFE